ncbi:MAG: hypothetical protein KGL39_08965 [Patescibacteria group bacterium]|nr:hypothetical protein [Patescibacteria group bacterium]
MALTIPYLPPIVILPSGNADLDVVSYPVHSACTANAIVTLGVTTAGEIDPASANDSSNKLLGIIQAASTSVYNSDGDAQSVFGTSPFGTSGQALGPSTGPQTPLVVYMGPPFVVEINLTQATGWVSGGTYQANIGSTFGLAIDATTGFYLADVNASNKVGVIVEKVIGATTQIVTAQAEQPVGPGGVGDLGARVRVTFNASAMAIAGAI